MRSDAILEKCLLKRLATFSGLLVSLSLSFKITFSTRYRDDVVVFCTISHIALVLLLALKCPDYFSLFLPELLLF